MHNNHKYVLRAIWDEDADLKDLKYELKVEYRHYAESESNFNPAYFLAEALKVVSGYYNTQGFRYNTKLATNKLNTLLKSNTILNKISREHMAALIEMCSTLFPVTSVYGQKYKKYLLKVYEKKYNQKYIGFDSASEMAEISRQLDDMSTSHEQAKAAFYENILKIPHNTEILLASGYVGSQFHIPSERSDIILKRLVLESFQLKNFHDAFLLLNSNLNILKDGVFLESLKKCLLQLGTTDAAAALDSLVKVAGAAIGCSLAVNGNLLRALDYFGFTEIVFSQAIKGLSVDNFASFVEIAGKNQVRRGALYDFIFNQTDQESRYKCMGFILRFALHSPEYRKDTNWISEMLVKHPSLALDLLKYYYDVLPREVGRAFTQNDEADLFKAIAQSLEKMNFIHAEDIWDLLNKMDRLENRVNAYILKFKFALIFANRRSGKFPDSNPLLSRPINFAVNARNENVDHYDEFLERIYKSKPSYTPPGGSKSRTAFGKLGNKVRNMFGLKTRFGNQYTKVVGLLKAWALEHNCYDNSEGSQRKIDNYDTFLRNVSTSNHSFLYSENFDADVKSSLETILYLLNDTKIPLDVKTLAIDGLTERLTVCGPGVRQGIQECLLFLKQGDIIDKLNLFKYSCAIHISEKVFNSTATHYVTAILKHLDANGFNMPLGLFSKVEDKLFSLDNFGNDSMSIKQLIVSEYSDLYRFNGFVKYLIDSVPQTGFTLESIAEDPILLSSFNALSLCSKQGVVDNNKVMLAPRAMELKEITNNLAECLSFADQECNYILVFGNNLDLKFPDGKSLIRINLEKDADFKNVVVCEYTGKDGQQHKLELYGDKWLAIVEDLEKDQRVPNNLLNFDSRMFELLNAYISSFPIKINEPAVRQYVFDELQDKGYINSDICLLNSDLHPDGQLLPIKIDNNKDNLQVVLDKKDGQDNLFFCKLDSDNKIQSSHDYTQSPLSAVEQDLLVATFNSLGVEIADRLVQQLVDTNCFEVLKIIYARCDICIQHILMSSPEVAKVIDIVFDEKIESRSGQTLMLRMFRDALTEKNVVYRNAIMVESLTRLLKSSNPLDELASQARDFGFIIDCYAIHMRELKDYFLVLNNLAQPDYARVQDISPIKKYLPDLYTETLKLFVLNPNIITDHRFWKSVFKSGDLDFLQDLCEATKDNNVLLNRDKMSESLVRATEAQLEILATCFEPERRNGFRP